MAHTVTVLENLSIIRIIHSGDIDLPDMLEARKKAGALMREQRSRRLLVDVRQVPRAPQTFENFEIASSHHMDLPTGVRIAVLVPQDQWSDGQFAENVSQNRGFNMKIFASDARALAWLTEEE